jgi:hypothetical protein
MEGVIEIREGDVVLARHIPSHIAWNDGLGFFSSDQDFIQVGVWGYNSGKVLKAHIHNQALREVHWTQEVLYVRSGRIRATVFDMAERRVAELLGTEGDILVLLRGGHGYEILQDGTRVLEVKNGPYLGAEADRRRL